MNIDNGNILSLVSLPDFDPNKRENIKDKNYINNIKGGKYFIHRDMNNNELINLLVRTDRFMYNLSCNNPYDNVSLYTSNNST